MLLFAVGEAGHARLGILRALAVALISAQLLLSWAGPKMAPARREEEYARVYRLISAGPFAARHRAAWALSIASIALFALPGPKITWAVAAVLALAVLALEQDTLVRAGQAASIS